MKNLWLFIILVLAVLGFTASTALAQTFPKPVGLVNDFANLLPDPAERQLEARLVQLEKDTTAEVAVVTIISLEGESMELYADGLFNAWGIGKDEKDNGVLFIIALVEHEMRIEVGYGLEPVITDGRAGRILDREVVPRFKEGDYEQGIVSGVAAIADYIRNGTPASFPEENPVGNLINGSEIPVWLLIVLGIITIYMMGFMARSKSIWLGGTWGLVVGTILGLVLGSLAALILLPIGSTVLGLLLDWILSRNYRNRSSGGQPTNWGRTWGGFSGYGGGGHSSGFGGFGGGSSGGGGAGRRW
ncbi:MAG: TPM domain-containing protein [Dehalococcoidia bacterium]|nr:TPM domain-containing protein [Dehalococcoidia bacterium]